MKAIWKYIISLLLVLPLLSFGQKELQRQSFIRIGFDLSRIALPVIHDFGLSGFEMAMDGELKYKFFPTLEVGYNKVKDYNELHYYELSGNYFRLGLNYNMLNYKQRFDKNIFFVGARYGNSRFYHQASYNFSNIWGDTDLSMPKTQLSANWFEGVMGMRGEVLKNFYIGYTIRVKSMIAHTDYENYTPFWVPGYGKATKSITVGMSYSVFYAIPIKDPKPDYLK